MAMFPRFSTRRRVTVRLLTAVTSGVIIAVSIGLGAHNPVWVAILGGCGIVAGLAISPRPSRLTEVRQWELAGSAPGTRVQVESVTRSAINATSVQPTSVTATVTPAGDVSYRTTWITAMNKSFADSLLSSGDAKLLPVSVPPRPARGRRTTTPQFSNYPGAWAVIYPAVTLVVCAIVLFGVPATAWQVNVSLPSISTSGSESPGESSSTASDRNLNSRLRALIDKMRTIAPTTVRTALSIRLGESGSDYADFYDPDTGQQISLYRQSDGEFSEPTRRASQSRDDDTFDPNQFLTTDLAAVVTTTEDALARAARPTTVDDIAITKPYDYEKPLISVSFEDSDIDDMEADANGVVAEYFDPGDFATSFRIARDALIAQRLPLSMKIFDRFEIRGTAPSTPIMFAGSIQNSGGVLLDFTTTTRWGDIALRPGQFPRVRSNSASREVADRRFLLQRTQSYSVRLGPGAGHGAWKREEFRPERHRHRGNGFVVIRRGPTVHSGENVEIRGGERQVFDDRDVLDVGLLLNACHLIGQATNRIEVEVSLQRAARACLQLRDGAGRQVYGPFVT
ncbi:hypothetical protein GOEFS_105_00580 [Gordonia effusa NBRC 100432]|uniref:Uncharacterized protein n=1 Tax=Gordonia effusa NBRC 100432 TaxID=1077974 RepID=H0R4P6_9ACTN|nr:hypothetical protein [Gordonia effusa]GAB20047.1 hypothetical protein GOEFS_105_00580 [Gordonia effusa NBRC 100432]